MENSNIITAKHLFDLVESLCFYGTVSKRGHTITILINSSESKIFRVSKGNECYKISKTFGVEISIHRYESCDSLNSCVLKPLETSYNDLINSKEL